MTRLITDTTNSMHTYTITITTQEKLTPGSLDHLLAIAANPNNRNAVGITEHD